MKARIIPLLVGAAFGVGTYASYPNNPRLTVAAVAFWAGLASAGLWYKEDKEPDRKN
jgi:hypothetical protein